MSDDEIELSFGDQDGLRVKVYPCYKYQHPMYHSTHKEPAFINSPYADENEEC